MLRLLSAIFGLMLVSGSAMAQSQTPLGVWLHDNQRIQIEISPCADALCAKIVWLKYPNDARGMPRVDFRNPQAALRDRPLLNLRVLEGLRQTGDNSWEDGKIYNPDDGSEYRGRLSIGSDGNLLVRAYLLIPLFGRTFVWTRVH
ncbi:MAG TPA: DUF2147 domain-containing protein [Rhizomicrobium sp.]|nr:DUF2147 domain-containing protein [Rhizomicrobium sp.]